MTFPAALDTHLASGATTVCRAYAVRRTDGVTLGFTDHDRDLVFGGLTYRAESGLGARAFETATGLSVSNSEVVGVLTSDALRDEDIQAGRWDAAEVEVWLVNWQDPDMRALRFRGTLGEITRSGRGFRAELRGLADGLNRPHGRVFQARCQAVLGDGACGFDLRTPGYSIDAALIEVLDAGAFAVAPLSSHVARFFERGRLTVVDGPAAGLTGVVKNDRSDTDRRTFELWQSLGAVPRPGDNVRIEAGCDRRVDTCRIKFSNIANFQGYPTMPGEDWLMSVPTRAGVNDGGSLRG